MDNNETRDLCYRVLQPFKFLGVVVKPFVSKGAAPTYIQLSQGDAEALAAAGLVSLEDPALPPSLDGEGHCESAASDCGPVEFHDSEGVPLCRRCYEALADDARNPDTSMTTTAETGGGQQDQAAAGEAKTDDEQKFDAADSGNTASQESDSTVSNAGDAGTPGATEAAAGGESPAGAAAEIEILHGSDNFPALIKIGDQEVQLGELVAYAQAVSPHNAAASNALPATARDELIQAAIDGRTSAAEKASAAGKSTGKKKGGR